MTVVQKGIPDEILDELCSRFLSNIPSDKRDDPVQILFAVELAFWHYTDVYLTSQSTRRKYTQKQFSKQIFLHCPFLKHYAIHIDQIYEKWLEIKASVPTYGAILIDPSYQYVLLVQGYFYLESWGFPKGKIQENELPIQCARREVLEEVGFDIKSQANENEFLECQIKQRTSRLYLVKNVPMNTNFISKTTNEIKTIRWFLINDLPAYYEYNSNKKLKHSAFYMVIPFVEPLRAWIHHVQHAIYSSIIDRNDLNGGGGKRRERASTFRDNAAEKNQSTTSKSVRCASTELDSKNRIQRNGKQSKNNERTMGFVNSENHSLSNEEPILTFSYDGPKCWTNFRLNRLEINQLLLNLI